MTSFIADIRFAVRSAIGQPITASIIVISLALGLTAATTIYSVVDEVLFRSFPYPRANEIMSVQSVRRSNANDRRPFSFQDFRVLSGGSRVLASVAAYAEADFNLSVPGGTPMRLTGARVSGSLWPLLQMAPLIGNTFTTSDDLIGGRRSVVISNSLWQTQFGGRADVLGQSMLVDGVSYEVVGVMAQTMRFPEQALFWVPLLVDPATDGPAYRRLRVIGRLRAGDGLVQAEADLASLEREMRKTEVAGADDWNLRVAPLRETIVGAGVRPTLLLMQAVSGVVLLLAAINAFALFAAWWSKRSRELSIRASLGASRWSLLRLLTMASLLLAMLGGAVALGLSALALNALHSAIPIEMPAWLPLQVDVRVVAFTTFISILVGLAAGVVPALRASRPDLVDALKDGQRGVAGGTRRRRFRAALTVGQVSLSIALVTLSTLLAMSYRNLRVISPGFDVANVQVTHLIFGGAKYATDTSRASFVSALTARIARAPGVTAAAVVNNFPLSGSNSTASVWSDRLIVAGKPQEVTANQLIASPAYLAATQTPLLYGRWFDMRDKIGSTPVAVVSAALAKRLWGGTPSEEQTLHLGKLTGRAVTVIGVVGDVKSSSLADVQAMAVYEPYDQAPWGTIDVVVRSSLGSGPMAIEIRGALGELDRDLPVGPIQSGADIVNRSLWQPRLYGGIIISFAMLALTLSLVGVYGVASEGAAGRVSELGIRAALGATHGQLLGLMMRAGLRLTAAAVLVGLVLSLASAQAARSMLFGVSPTDTALVSVVCIGLGLITLAAYAVPIMRVVRSDIETSIRDAT